ncbi:MAG: DNA primase family protein [Bryobacteraceae bacterium]
MTAQDRELREAQMAIVNSKFAHDDFGPRNGSTSGETADLPKLLDYPFTDVGNAERMVEMHGAELRYCHPWGKWLYWNEERWCLDATAEVVRRAKATTRKMFMMAARLSDSDKRDRLFKHARDTEKYAHLNAMIALAAAEEKIPVLPADLDSDPWLLNVLNGTVDLRTGKLGPHCREHLITKLAPVEYDAGAECPMWLAFQEKIMGGNAELIRFKQRAVGYSLTGIATDKRSLFMYYGSKGNNGKTTELEMLREILGEYAGQIRVEQLMEQQHQSGNAPSPDIADLRGQRFVLASEPRENQRLAEAKIKYLTGMGTIKARHLHKENDEFKQTWKIFMECNHKPVISGTDPAIWNRIGLIPFEVEIPAEEIDMTMPAKLRSELPGILAWAVRGCLDWQRNPVTTPDQVRDATAEYRSEMDVIGRFISECCVVGDYSSCRAKNLYSAYKIWAEKSGENAISMTTFGNVVTNRGYRKTHDMKGNKYDGIGLSETA